MSRVAKASFALAVLVLGIAICLFTDLYLRAQAPDGTDVESWNILGTILIGGGGSALAFAIFFPED